MRLIRVAEPRIGVGVVGDHAPVVRDVAYEVDFGSLSPFDTVLEEANNRPRMGTFSRRVESARRHGQAVE